jgi:small subunit ribosomal protein S17
MAKKIVGTVTSDVQDKTIVVSVTRRETHPIYGKQYTVTNKFAAHDEKNQAHIGDKVEIVETRPISKNKTFNLSRVIETGHAAIELKEEEEVLAPAAEAKAEKPASVESKDKEKEA